MDLACSTGFISFSWRACVACWTSREGSNAEEAGLAMDRRTLVVEI
jgi:hypothetical protein